MFWPTSTHRSGVLEELGGGGQSLPSVAHPRHETIPDPAQIPNFLQNVLRSFRVKRAEGLHLCLNSSHMLIHSLQRARHKSHTHTTHHRTHVSHYKYQAHHTHYTYPTYHTLITYFTHSPYFIHIPYIIRTSLIIYVTIITHVTHITHTSHITHITHINTHYMYMLMQQI